MFRSLLCHTTERRCIVELGYFNNIVEWATLSVAQVMAEYGDGVGKLFLTIVTVFAITSAIMLIVRDKRSRHEGAVMLALALTIIAVVFSAELRWASGAVMLLGGLVVITSSISIIKHLGGVRREQ